MLAAIHQEPIRFDICIIYGDYSVSASQIVQCKTCPITLGSPSRDNATTQALERWSVRALRFGRKKRQINSYMQKKKQNKQSRMFTNPHPHLLGMGNLNKMRGGIIYYMKSKNEKVAAQTR